MNRVKKIMLSTFCSLVLLASVFSITAYATTTMSNWQRFTQQVQGFTLTGEWQTTEIVGNERQLISRARGLSIVRCAGARAGAAVTFETPTFDFWRAPGVTSHHTRTTHRNGLIVGRRELRIH